MSRPAHLPVESWNAKPGMPVSTPQISSPRFLIASMVGLLTSCAQLPDAKPSMPATTAAHVASLVQYCIVAPFLMWTALRHETLRSIVDRRRVPTLGPLRPERLAQ